jgi:hypothetical protein
LIILSARCQGDAIPRATENEFNSHEKERRTRALDNAQQRATSRRIDPIADAFIDDD